MPRPLRTAAFFLAAGVLATGAAAACSLLVDGVAAKRVVWATVLVVGGIGAGVRRARREAKAADSDDCA
jgi:hypothetical protein